MACRLRQPRHDPHRIRQIAEHQREVAALAGFCRQRGADTLGAGVGSGTVASTLERGCARCGQKCVPRRSGGVTHLTHGRGHPAQMHHVDGPAGDYANLLSIELAAADAQGVSRPDHLCARIG
jgi:hypothetical protein